MLATVIDIMPLMLAAEPFATMARFARRFGLGVNRSHRLRELQIDIVTDCYRPEIGILAIEAALRRLIGVLEPVIADDRAPAQGGRDVAPETRRPLDLRRHQRAGAVGIGQDGVNGAKGELADQAGLAGNGIVVDHSARIDVVAIERDDIAMASGGIDDAARRQVGEAGAEHEMVRVGGLDGGARQRKIAFRDVRGEVVAIGGEPGAPGIGTIGRQMLG